MIGPSTKAQADTDTGKPAASGGSGFSARAGGSIRGNLFRGTGGKFQAGPGAQLQDRLAKLRAAMPKGKLRAKAGKGKKGKGKSTKPKQSPEQRAAAKEQQRVQNRTNVLDTLTSKPNAATLNTLDALAKGDAVDPDMAAAIADETGLAERHADGSITLSAAGKKLLGALDKGDVASAAAALSGAGDKQAKQDERAQAKEARQQAAAQRKVEREKAKAGRAAKKKKAGEAKPAAAPQTSPDREQAKQERDAARTQRTAEQAARKQARADAQAAKEKTRAADKAGKEKQQVAQQERQTDRAVRLLSRGGTVGDQQLLDMEDAGLVTFDKTNTPQLTEKGKKRLQARQAPARATPALPSGPTRRTTKR